MTRDPALILNTFHYYYDGVLCNIFALEYIQPSATRYNIEFLPLYIYFIPSDDECLCVCVYAVRKD